MHFLRTRRSFKYPRNRGRNTLSRAFLAGHIQVAAPALLGKLIVRQPPNQPIRMAAMLRPGGPQRDQARSRALGGRPAVACV
jgi:hypothetical protein